MQCWLREPKQINRHLPFLTTNPYRRSAWYSMPYRALTYHWIRMKSRYFPKVLAGKTLLFFSSLPVNLVPKAKSLGTSFASKIAKIILGDMKNSFHFCFSRASQHGKMWKLLSKEWHRKRISSNYFSSDEPIIHTKSSITHWMFKK